MKHTHGGARPNSGPKKKKDSEKKMPITTHHIKGWVKQKGGKEKVKKLIYDKLKEE